MSLAFCYAGHIVRTEHDVFVHYCTLRRDHPGPHVDPYDRTWTGDPLADFLHDEPAS